LAPDSADLISDIFNDLVDDKSPYNCAVSELAEPVLRHERANLYLAWEQENVFILILFEATWVYFLRISHTILELRQGSVFGFLAVDVFTNCTEDDCVVNLRFNNRN
jgi:hypothetical protein